MAAQQAPPSLGFSRQEHLTGLPFPSPMHESEKWKWSRSVMSGPQWSHGLQPSRLLHPWDFPGKSTGVGCHCLLRKIYLDLHKRWKFSTDSSYNLHIHFPDYYGTFVTLNELKLIVLLIEINSFFRFSHFFPNNHFCFQDSILDIIIHLVMSP